MDRNFEKDIEALFEQLEAAMKQRPLNIVSLLRPLNNLIERFILAYNTPSETERAIEGFPKFRQKVQEFRDALQELASKEKAEYVSSLPFKPKDLEELILAFKVKTDHLYELDHSARSKKIFRRKRTQRQSHSRLSSLR